MCNCTSGNPAETIRHFEIPDRSASRTVRNDGELESSPILSSVCRIASSQRRPIKSRPGRLIMKSISANIRSLVIGVVGALLLAGWASAAEVRVMISGGLTAAFKELVPEFERLTGNKVLTAYGPSMGTTVNAIPVRLERGEAADVLIMVGYALGDLIKQGKVVADSRVDLTKSPIGIAVKSGAPKPDIGSADAVKRAPAGAESIALSHTPAA